MIAHDTTNKPFGAALADLLREHDYTTQTGNVNWNAFASVLEIDYETLRKAVAGIRPPTPYVLEDVARALAIKPEHFAEYRMHQAARRFDPREVGFEQALKNVEAEAEQNRRR